MKTKFRFLMISMLCLVMLFSAGCNAPLELGRFERATWKENVLGIGVKTEGRKFDMENVVLDVHYGYGYDLNYELLYNEDEYVGYALYFFNAEISVNEHDITYVGVENFREIEGLWFVKEIPLEEFEDYVMTNKQTNPNLTVSEFSHHEKIAVPKGVISGQSGHLGIWLNGVSRNAETGKYFFNGMFYKIYIKYRQSGTDTVKLYKSKEYKQEFPITIENEQ